MARILRLAGIAAVLAALTSAQNDCSSVLTSVSTEMSAACSDNNDACTSQCMTTLQDFLSDSATLACLNEYGVTSSLQSAIDFCASGGPSIPSSNSDCSSEFSTMSTSLYTACGSGSMEQMCSAQCRLEVDDLMADSSIKACMDEYQLTDSFQIAFASCAYATPGTPSEPGTAIHANAVSQECIQLLSVASDAIVSSCGEDGENKCAAACKSSIDALNAQASMKTCLDQAGFNAAVGKEMATCSSASAVAVGAAVAVAVASLLV
jgi:hypothetical protein